MADTRRDVCLSSMVRIHRNLTDVPFPQKMSLEDVETALSSLRDALPQPMHPRDPAALAAQFCLTPPGLEALNTRGYTGPDGTAVFLLWDDALRACCSQPGYALETACERAIALEEAIGMRIPFAFDPAFGFLTARPTMSGTGFKAGMLLHVPALGRMQKAQSLLTALGKQDILWRDPLGGQRSETSADLCYLENRKTLGQTEAELLQTVQAAADGLIHAEREAREAYLMTREGQLVAELVQLQEAMQEGPPARSGVCLKGISLLRLCVVSGLARASLDELDRLLLSGIADDLRAHAFHQIVQNLGGNHGISRTV